MWYNQAMYEIELKAHVEDRKAVIKNLERFADFSGAGAKNNSAKCTKIAQKLCRFS